MILGKENSLVSCIRVFCFVYSREIGILMGALSSVVSGVDEIQARFVLAKKSDLEGRVCRLKDVAGSVIRRRNQHRNVLAILVRAGQDSSFVQGGRSQSMGAQKGEVRLVEAVQEDGEKKRAHAQERKGNEGKGTTFCVRPKRATRLCNRMCSRPHG